MKKYHCPDDYLVQLETRTSNTFIGPYTYFQGKSGTVKKGKDVALVIRINTTKFWEWSGTTIANENGSLVIAASSSGGPTLLNTYGKEYPLFYSDPQSGISLYTPC